MSIFNYQIKHYRGRRRHFMFTARQIGYQKDLGHRDSISKNKQAHITSQEMKKTNDTNVLAFKHY
jgi:hypothetical protein